MKRGFISILLFLMVTFLHAKTLIVGTMLYDPPFEMVADKENHLFGFDIDIMNAICQEMKVDCQFKPLLFEQLFLEINRKTIDLVIAAVTITKERQQQYLFSLPYLETNARFITLNTSDIKSLSDLKNKKIGTLKGSIYPALVQNMFQNNSTVIEYSYINQIYNALVQHTIDAAVGAAISIEYWVANNSSLVKIVGDRIPVGNGVGIMANKDEVLLIQQVNQALERIENNGVYLSIYERYFGKEQPQL